ncbi:hypothetical protein AB2L27_00230 [Kineococcus sp. LSe6-4]|uniref:Secreted protein n=1 Tax=Kineococcus halophytocola TaxID=3234027 RepID=A0ABV4GV53_9ACTN
MLRRRDVLVLGAVGALAACGDEPGGAPGSPSAWPGDLPAAPGTWQEIPAAPMSARRMPTLTWTGTELLVTGGTGRVVGPTVSCPPNALCEAPPTEPLEGSGAFDPATGTWRALTGGNTFHHGPTWTGRLLSDGWTWFDPATDTTGPAPESDLLVRAPAAWSGTEVLCVGTDGSGQPVPHTLWAWDPATGATRTVRVPGPDSGETCHTLWAGDELLVGLTQLPPGAPAVQAFDPAADAWHTVPMDVAVQLLPPGGWDGERVVGLGFAEAEVPRLERTDPTDGATSPVPLPAALDSRQSVPDVAVGTGRVAVGVGPRYAVLDGGTWTALPALPALPGVGDDERVTTTWAGDRFVAWDDTLRRTGWWIELG